jgi:two-component system sensor histidine kinase ResE
MFRFRSLFGRLMSLYVLIVIGTLGLLGLLLSRLLQDYFFAAKQQELVSQGERISELAVPLFVRGGDQVRARQALGVAGRLLTGGALIIDRNTKVVASIGRRPSQEVMGQLPCPITQQLPDLMAAMEGKVVTRTGYSPVFRESAFFAAVPIRLNGRVVGATIMHAPVLGLRDSIVHTRLLVFGLALAAIALSAALGYLLARSVADPLDRMSRVAGQMAAGDFESRVPERGSDEVGRLAAALNQLSSSLHHTIQSLSEEQSKLGHVVTTMGEGVIAVDRGGQVIMANPQAQKMLAPNESELAGRSLGESALAAAFAKAMSEAREQRVEFRSRDGTAFLQAHISPTAVEGSTVGAVAVVQDVTELQRVERMRRQFVADASHQLRSPLTAMQGYAEAVLDEVAADEETRRRYLATIVRDSKRLNRLIEQLLDLSHIESGQARLEPRPLALAALLQRAVDSIPPADSHPEIIVDAPDGLPLALADEAYTEQALLNLIRNAVRHTPPQGEVRVWARAESSHLVVGVTDTGAGIAPEHLPRIWDRFYRAGETDKDGAGLGLAIVKSLIERQGGQVNAESRPGAGSTFTFTLPLARTQS